MVVGSGWGRFGSLKFETVSNDSIFNSQKNLNMSQMKVKSSDCSVVSERTTIC